MKILKPNDIEGVRKNLPAPPNSPIKATGRKQTEVKLFGFIAKKPQAASKCLTHPCADLSGGGRIFDCLLILKILSY